MSNNLSRRTFLQYAVAATAATQLPTTVLTQQHPQHDFLTRVGVDSSTAPENISLYFKDCNRSILNIDVGEETKAFDIRLRGGQTEESVCAHIRNHFVDNLGAKPLPV